LGRYPQLTISQYHRSDASGAVGLVTKKPDHSLRASSSSMREAMS
jgi:hypothetical protein